MEVQCESYPRPNNEMGRMHGCFVLLDGYIGVETFFHRHMSVSCQEKLNFKTDQTQFILVSHRGHTDEKVTKKKNLICFMTLVHIAYV